MDKTRKKYIFGMTYIQMAILACLAFAIIGIVFVGFYKINNSATPGDSSFPQNSEPSNPFEQIIPPDPIETSDLPPEAIFVPNDNPLPPDWKQYATTRIELWLPPQFESVFVEPQRQERIAFYRQQGYDFLAEDLEDETFDYRFWFNFPQPDTVLYKTNITVKADILPTETLDEYVDQVYGAGLPGFEFAGREEVDFAEFEARRILMTANLNDLSIGVADYVITDEINLWIIRGGASLDEYYSWLPEFDRIARSLRLVN